MRATVFQMNFMADRQTPLKQLKNLGCGSNWHYEVTKYVSVHPSTEQKTRIKAISIILIDDMVNDICQFSFNTTLFRKWQQPPPELNSTRIFPSSISMSRKPLTGRERKLKMTPFLECKVLIPNAT